MASSSLILPTVTSVSTTAGINCYRGLKSNVVCATSSLSVQPLCSPFSSSPSSFSRFTRSNIQKSKVEIRKNVNVIEAVSGVKKNFEKTIVSPDYRIPAVLIGTAGTLFLLDQKLAAAPIGLLGAFLAFQTTRVRFLFDEDSLEVVIGEQADKSGENVFVGGENRWKYETFTNWEFWWPGFPVLVYFKETQTKPEGQVHFFPIIADGKQLYDLMKERCGPSMNSVPK